MLSFTPMPILKIPLNSNSPFPTLYSMLVLLLGTQRDTLTVLVLSQSLDVCLLVKTFKLGLDHIKELKPLMVEAGNHTKKQTSSLLLSLNTYLVTLPSPLLLPLYWPTSLTLQTGSDQIQSLSMLVNLPLNQESLM